METGNYQVEEDCLRYKTMSGEYFQFDISERCYRKFGFHPNSRVLTPRGLATVIGIYNHHLWFHIDGDKGATYWRELVSPDQFKKWEFRVIHPATKRNMFTNCLSKDFVSPINKLMQV